MQSNKNPGFNLLVTLLCPNCKHRVAVMEFFPFSTRTIKPGDITLIDGSDPTDVNRLVCRRCFTVFPPKKAAIPKYLIDAATGELQKEYRKSLKAADALPG